MKKTQPFLISNKSTCSIIFMGFFLLSIGAVQSGEKNAIAIIPVQSPDTPPEYAWLSDELVTTLLTHLSPISTIQLVERRRVNKILEEQKFQSTAWAGGDKVSDLGNLIGADYLLIVQYHIHEVDALFNARLVSVKTGEVIMAAQSTGNSYYLRAALRQLGNKVHDRIQIFFTTPAHRKNKPYHPQAVAEFQKGSTLIGSGNSNVKEQIASYQKALVIEPDFLEAHFNLANVYASLKLYNKAALEYREVLRIDSEYLFALENLALLFGKIPLTRKEAISLWERALKLEQRLDKIKDIEKNLVELRKKSN